MSKFFSFSRNQIAVLGTLLLLFILGAFYFMSYLPRHEKMVQERRFRCLRNIDDNVRAKIRNSRQVMDNLLDAYQKNEQNEKVLDSINNYIKVYPKTAFVLLPLVATKSLTEISLKKSQERDSVVSVTMIPDLDLRQFTLNVCRTIKSPGLTRTFSIGIKFDFKQFLTPLPVGVFNNYIIFNNNKKVYETFASGLSYKNKDSLLAIKSGIISPGFRSLKIGGSVYKEFAQPVSLGDGSEWVIVGLVSDEDYQLEKNQLPTETILLLITTALILVVSLPWVKLYQMGNKDKLTIADGVASVLISMILVSLLFLACTKYNFRQNYLKTANSATLLADTITQQFEKELSVTDQKLQQLDSLHHAEIKGDIAKLKVSPTDGYNQPVLNSRLTELVKDIDVKQVFWLDSGGRETTIWTTEQAVGPHILLNDRAYFKNVLSDKPNNGFYLDQVLSRTSNIFTSVIAKRSMDDDKVKVAAMTFTARSLDNVVMPKGYEFAIIDDKANVLYHYLADRNLTENLKQEFADSSQLISSLEAKSDTSFTTKYYGKRYKIKIKPIKLLPNYFTVVFEDLSYNDSRNVEPYTFTLTMVVCLLFFMIIQITVIFFTSSRRSFFKKQLFDTSWIGPKRSSHLHYDITIIYNCVIILMLVIFFNLHSFLAYLYIVLFAITITSIFLNGSFAISYYKDHNPNKYLLKMIAVWSLIGFILLINLAAFNTLESKNFLFPFLFFEATSVALCGIVYWVKKRRMDIVPKWTYTHSYALMATTRLIISSGIPVAFFFVYSFNYEQALLTRTRQLDFARALTQRVRVADIKARMQDSAKTSNLLRDSSIYRDGIFISSIKLDALTPPDLRKLNETLKYSREDSLTMKLLSGVRLVENQIEIRSKNMNLQYVGDNEAFFNNLANQQRSITQTYYRIANGLYLDIKSSNIDYSISKTFFLIFILIATAGFFVVMHNIILKIFALNLPSVNLWNQIDEKLILNNDVNKLLLVLGSPGSGKLSKLRTTLKQKNLLGNMNERLVLEDTDHSKINVFIADMILISSQAGEDDPDWKKCKEEALKDYSLVIINHFEYNVKDSKTNSIKLDFLESLMQRGKSKIIIISTVHPLTFLDSYKHEQKDPIPESELERWHVILGHFRIVIEPLERSENDGLCNFVTSHSETTNQTTFIRRTLTEETRYTHFLKKMQEIKLDIPKSVKTKEIGLVSDSLILKLQLSSQYFYTYIWQSLTMEEKFLLYDLAEDGLVNSFDDYNLGMLISKGLIIREDGTLSLFNKGFRNFILTAIGNTELERIKAQVKDNGNWGSLKTPVTIAVLAILSFLLISQQEAFTRVITYVTAIGAGVPAVLKIFSMFGNDGKKAE